MTEPACLPSGELGEQIGHVFVNCGANRVVTGVHIGAAHMKENCSEPDEGCKVYKMTEKMDETGCFWKKSCCSFKRKPNIGACMNLNYPNYIRADNLTCVEGTFLFRFGDSYIIM